MEATVSVKGLYKAFRASQFFGRRKAPVPALEGINFELFPAEMVALVGESGSGKTTLGRCILGLVPFERGTVRVNGFNVGELTRTNEKAFRMSAQMVFQNPYASLNPAFKARAALVEAVRIHNPSITKREAQVEVEKLAKLVQLPVERLGEYPPSLSGGERRRVVFARALATNPKFVVTDEPVSGLDQPIQAQLLDLLRRIHEKQGTTMLFISHDLRLVRFLSSRVLVLHRGRIVEDATADIFFNKGPSHPYSVELLESAFKSEGQNFPHVQRPPPERGSGGCSFRNRCKYGLTGDNRSCADTTPPLLEVEAGHRVACHCCQEESG
jgi:oligopeptide/dipeptide ABC transporter ATP-binding protein